MSCENNVNVTLNNDSTGNFYTGDIVTGTITLDLEKDVKIERIDLEVVGISKAQWTRASPTIPYIKIYSEKKKVFHVMIPDIFFDGVRRDKKMRSGIYSYPFHFALPHDLPSTFKSSIASVNYNIKIKSKPSYKIKKCVSFSVVSNLNLNHLDDMLTPYEYKFEQSFRSVAAKVAVTLRSFRSFASKQIVPFEFIIQNEEKIKIKKLKMTLVQKLLYNVPSGYAEDEKRLCSVDYHEMENNTLEVCHFNMEIPNITPSSINVTEPLINISYYIKVEVVFAYHLNLSESIPVIVAAVPVIHHDFYVLSNS